MPRVFGGHRSVGRPSHRRNRLIRAGRRRASSPRVTPAQRCRAYRGPMQRRWQRLWRRRDWVLCAVVTAVMLVEVVTWSGRNLATAHPVRPDDDAAAGGPALAADPGLRREPGRCRRADRAPCRCTTGSASTTTPRRSSVTYFVMIFSLGAHTRGREVWVSVAADPAHDGQLLRRRGRRVRRRRPRVRRLLRRAGPGRPASRCGCAATSPRATRSSSASRRSRPGGRSPRSAPPSPASCTTSSPTRSR